MAKRKEPTNEPNAFDLFNNPDNAESPAETLGKLLTRDAEPEPNTNVQPLYGCPIPSDQQPQPPRINWPKLPQFNHGVIPDNNYRIGIGQPPVGPVYASSGFAMCESISTPFNPVASIIPDVRYMQFNLRSFRVGDAYHIIRTDRNLGGKISETDALLQNASPTKLTFLITQDGQIDSICITIEDMILTMGDLDKPYIQIYYKHI